MFVIGYKVNSSQYDCPNKGVGWGDGMEAYLLHLTRIYSKY